MSSPFFLALSILCGVGGVLLLSYKFLKRKAAARLPFSKKATTEMPWPCSGKDKDRDQDRDKNSDTEDTPPPLKAELLLAQSESPLAPGKQPTPKAKKKRAWVFLGFAMSLSAFIAFAPWLFPSGKQTLGFISDFIFSLLAVFPALYFVVGMFKKGSLLKEQGYGPLLIVASVALALLAVKSKSDASYMPAPPPKPAELWQLIADAPSIRTGSDEEAYWVYAVGQFDLSEAHSMRLSFAPSQAGTKFLLRLVPMGSGFSGLHSEIFSIPASGIVEVPLKAAAFGLKPANMRQLKEIAVISGSHAWGRSLEQPADKRADFKKIEVQY